MRYLGLSVLLACSGGKSAEEDDTVADLLDDTQDTDDTQVGCDQTVDADCDGVPDEDDCDPNDGLVYPGAVEIPYDGKDNDCAGDGDLNDVDGDGYVGVNGGGDDCLDNDPSVYPGAPEICYDGVDQDCGGDLELENNNDCDGDGHVGRGDDATDCNDEDASVNPDQVEVWYDGIDQNCDAHSDYDADFDGEDTVDITDGTDCDDTDPLTYSANTEHWDGIDRDCDGLIDEMVNYDAVVGYFGATLAGNGNVGNALAALDDYDGDGLKEFVVGAPFSTADSENSPAVGWVHIFSAGLDDGAPDDNLSRIEANAAGYYLGFDLDNIGDLNNDGLDELAVGAPGVGRAYIFSGADLEAGGNMTISNAMSNVAGTELTGLLVSQVGDVNGDGVPDLGAGASHFDYNDTTWLGIWSGSDIAGGGAYGQSAALAVISATGQGGDIVTGLDSDGDAFADVLVSTNTVGTGRLAIVPGADMTGGVLLDVNNYADYITGSSGAQLGAYIGGLGDWNGNGYDDILIAAPGLNGQDSSGNEVDQGGVVYLVDTNDINGMTTVSDVALVTFYGEELGGRIQPIGRAGDYNADGVPDVILSQPGTLTINAIDSSIHLFSGSDIQSGGSYLVSEGSGTIFSRSGTTDYLGESMLSFDYDLDGDDDLLVGAPNYNFNGNLGWALGYALLFESEF
ncbi:MAG: MopE-related protein [Myxococcota bacterium]